jgi:hypothetical protein
MKQTRAGCRRDSDSTKSSRRGLSGSIENPPPPIATMCPRKFDVIAGDHTCIVGAPTYRAVACRRLCRRGFSGRQAASATPFLTVADSFVERRSLRVYRYRVVGRKLRTCGTVVWQRGGRGRRAPETAYDAENVGSQLACRSRRVDGRRRCSSICDDRAVYIVRRSRDRRCRGTRGWHGGSGNGGAGTVWEGQQRRCLLHRRPRRRLLPCSAGAPWTGAARRARRTRCVPAATARRQSRHVSATTLT